MVDVLGEGASGAIQIEAETRGKTKNDKSEDSHLVLYLLVHKYH